MLAHILLLGWCVVDASCAAQDQPSRVLAEELHSVPASPVVADAATGPSAATPSRITHELRPFDGQRGRGQLHRFRIPLAGTRIAFVDLGYEKPLVEALGEHDLVINGGYWAYYGEARKIQGLLTVNGRSFAPLANTLSGGIVEVAAGRARLLPVQRSAPSPAATLAVQCSPRLVVHGRPVAKLDSKHWAARTALCIRDQGRTLDAYLTDEVATSLAELGAWLAAEGCEAALNLDGGPSTAAVYRGPQRVESVGFGSALPYGLGFAVR